METRKIISFGKSSYVISVPKSWITENRLKKGDLLNIEDKKDELIVSLGNNHRETIPQKALIIIDSKSIDQIRIEVVSAYLNNYDVIEIKGNFGNNAQKLKAIIRNLTGLEIIQQDSSKIVAKDLLNINEISIETLVRRIDNIVRSMIIDSLSCIKKDCYESLFERDLDVNRLVFLAYRVIRAALKDSKIAKDLDKNNVELLFEWMIVKKMEKVGDDAKRIARHLRNANLDSNGKKQLEKLYEQIKNDYTEIMKAYYKKDLGIAFKTEVLNKARIQACNDFVQAEHNISVNRVFGHLKSMISNIKEIARNVIGMERNVE